MYLLVVDNVNDYAVIDLNDDTFEWIKLGKDSVFRTNWRSVHRFPEDMMQVKLVDIYDEVADARAGLDMLSLLDQLEGYKAIDAVQIFEEKQFDHGIQYTQAITDLIHRR